MKIGRYLLNLVAFDAIFRPGIIGGGDLHRSERHNPAIGRSQVLDADAPWHAQ